LAVRANHYQELTAFDNASHFDVPERQFVGRDFEGNGCSAPRLQRNTLKALELFHRPRDGAYLISDVQLNGFIPWSVTTIRDIDLNYG
jgi:hypothetical protein